MIGKIKPKKPSKCAFSMRFPFKWPKECKYRKKSVFILETKKGSQSYYNVLRKFL